MVCGLYIKDLKSGDVDDVKLFGGGYRMSDEGFVYSDKIAKRFETYEGHCA